MDQIDPQQQLDQQQESERKLYIRIPNEILEDERLTATDKLVYGRAYSFRHYYESAEATGKALAICPNQVKISKRKLEKLGFFVMYENTGRGKKYIVPEPHIRLSKFDSLTGRVSKFDSQSIKIESSEGQNLIPEIKERLKGEERISLIDKSIKEAQAPGDESEEVQLNEESQKRYGNAEVNEILDEWEEATGFSWHSTRQERFATNTLLRKYGSEATRALVRRVKVARRSDDQFAPQIAKPSQLVGKYEKLTALQLWEERQGKVEAKEVEAHAPAFIPEYMRPPEPQPEWRDVRPSTPEEKAEVHRKAMEIRAKLPFYVPKDQRKAGC